MLSLSKYENEESREVVWSITKSRLQIREIPQRTILFTHFVREEYSASEWRMTNDESLIIIHQRPITNNHIPITNHYLPITTHDQAPCISMRKVWQTDPTMVGRSDFCDIFVVIIIV